MTTTLRAVYTGGVLRPEQPLSLPDGQVVEVTISAANAAPAPSAMSEDEIIRQIEACKSYHDWFELTKLFPADDGGYDIVKALDDNRRWSGELPLLPDEDNRP